MSNRKNSVKNSSSVVTIGLLWHSLSSGNLGVGALTESNIAIVRKVAESMGLHLHFLVLGTGDDNLISLTDELLQAGHQIQNHKIRVFRKNFRALIRRCDLVLDIGEGDSFSDIYGLKRFLFYWLSKNIVCSLNIPLVLSPQTIGPFETVIARLLAKQVMLRCYRIFARDHLSSEYLAALGVTGNTDEAIDVAFRLPFVRQHYETKKVNVGINVSALLFNGGYTSNNQFGLSIDYADTIKKLIAEFCNKPEVQVHLISHVIVPEFPIEDDFSVSKKLAEEFPNVIVAPQFSRPGDAKSYISGMDYFFGARMHACIAAFSAGVPVIPMAYSRKFNGLFESLDYHNVADCKKDEQSKIIKQIVDGFSNREQLKTEVEQSLTKVNDKIGGYEQVLSEFLSGFKDSK